MNYKQFATENARTQAAPYGLNKTPSEECPPENVTELTIQARMDLDEVWHVHCPQWKFHQEGRNLTRMVALLVADIETHIDERHLNEPMWWKVNKKLMETVLGLKDHQADQAARLRARRPHSDDGKRTQRATLWQSPT